MSILDYARERDAITDRIYLKTNKKRKFFKQLDDIKRKYRNIKHFENIEITIECIYNDF